MLPCGYGKIFAGAVELHDQCRLLPQAQIGVPVEHSCAVSGNDLQGSGGKAPTNDLEERLRCLSIVGEVAIAAEKCAGSSASRTVV